MNATPTTLKDMAAHVRGRLKASGIKCRCFTERYCGVEAIHVRAVDLDRPFTDEEQRAMLLIMKVNRLTLSRRGEIDVEQMTYSWGGTFEFHGRE